jgi:hypothetical protein
VPEIVSVDSLTVRQVDHKAILLIEHYVLAFVREVRVAVARTLELHLMVKMPLDIHQRIRDVALICHYLALHNFI